MKLNKRLTELAQMVENPYDVVWDCCCDHGLLGLSILTNERVQQVNFVDVVPDIIEKLTQKMADISHHLPQDKHWRLLCQDVSTLNFFTDNSPEKKQLVIISGVGGELMISMLQSLMLRYRGADLDFLLCPVQHTYKLRSALNDLNFKLIKERLVIENGRGYEILLVNQHGNCPVSKIGSKLWEPIPSHAEYLSKLISHYQRVESMSDSQEIKTALNAYKNLYHKSYQWFEVKRG